MSKVANENKEMIERRLDYIGLNLNRIPKFLTEYEPLNFRPLKSNDEKTYKVYRYLNVQDIDILVTPMDRLADLKERYKLSAPLFTYLDSKSKENEEKYATFIKMLLDMKEEKIEELEEEQEKLKEKIPYKVKYKNHFMWQIYYSEYDEKYFMLVPTNEQDNSALFYLLKKMISSKKNRKKETIFVPISHLEYSEEYLTKTEIADMENYLWYFTKEWPSVYEVYDKKGSMSIRIVGKTKVYEKIESDYILNVESKKEAIELYKLLKALFIIATGAPDTYKFDVKIAENGYLLFYYNEQEMSYKKLSEFIKNEYLDKIPKLEKAISEKDKLKNRLNRFNIMVEELTQEYLAKQRQIATFLECKKSFLGKVKYFFKRKKESPVDVKNKKAEKLQENKKEKQEEQDLYEEKEQYTIEDLIDICTKLSEKLKENNNIELDINAIETKKEIIAKKIENADLYIKEIDDHKKSIFEFWKFTSKDEVQTLHKAEEMKQKQKEKIAKYFDYQSDLEELGKIVDEVQRRKLSKNETDAIFIAKDVIGSIRVLLGNITKDDKSIEKDLERLKKEYELNADEMEVKDFDIFGGLSDDKTKIKTINNEKHRENEKNKYKILSLNMETDIESYKNNLQGHINLISEALNKIRAPYDMSVYKVNNRKGIDGLDVFNINPQIPIEEEIKNTKKENIILSRINVKENMPMLYYSNIIFYDNTNKTLPVGMNLSSETLLDIEKIKVTCIKETNFNINYNVNDYEFTTKKIKVFEYDAEEKEKEVKKEVKEEAKEEKEKKEEK